MLPGFAAEALLAGLAALAAAAALSLSWGNGPGPKMDFLSSLMQDFPAHSHIHLGQSE